MKRFLLALLLLSPLYVPAAPVEFTPTLSPASPAFAIAVSISGSNTYCAGEGTLLTANVTGSVGAITYQWRRNGVAIPGATASTYNATQAGTYTVRVQDTVSNATSANFVVSQSSLTANAITGAGEFCAGSSTLLTANVTGGTGAYKYQWKLGGADIAGATASTHAATQPGNYTVVVIDAQNCSATSPVRAITQNPAPTVTATATSDVICAGGSVNLSAVAGAGTPPYSYQWKRGATNVGTNSPALNGVNIAGTYTVVVTDNKGCSVTSAALVISASNLDAQAIGGPAEFCVGSSITLTANFTGGVAPYTYQWQRGGANVGTNASTLSVNQAGSYTVRVTDSKGCFDDSPAKAIAQNPVPSANAGPGGTFTGNETYSLAGVTTGSGTNQPLTYAWTTAPGGVPINNPAAANPVIGPFTQSTTVQLTVTDSKGCQATSTSAITYAPCTVTATVAASPSNVICTPGQTITLTVTAGGGTPGYTYQWKKDGVNAGTNAPTLNVTAAGSYTVTVTDTKGCVLTPAATVVTASNLVAGVPNGASEFCANGSITLNANQSGGTGPFTYQWKNGGTNVGTNASTLSVNAAGSYSVVITDSKGCSVTSAAKDVSVNPVPTANAGPGKTLVCNEDYNLTGVTTASGGTGPYSYQWSTSPGGVSINNASTSNPILGPFPDVRTYNVTVLVTDSKGCQASQTAVVTKGGNPVSVNINAPFNTICPGATVTINASVNGNSGGPNYQWQNNGNNIDGQNGSTFIAGGAGNYRVVVTDNRGCRTESNTIGLNNSDLSVSISSPTNFRYCEQGLARFARLTANPSGGAGGYQYRWLGGSLTGQTTQTVDVFKGFYSVEITDAQGCKNRFGDVEVFGLQRPTANAGPGITLTGDEKYDLTKVANFTPATGGRPDYTYLWTSAPDTAVKSTQARPALGEFTRSNIVSLTVTDANGCVSDPDTARVTYLPCQLTARITGNNYVCNNNTTTLTANAANGWGEVRNYRYQWRLGNQLVNSDSLKLTVQRGGLYTLTAIDTRGCRRADTLRVAELPELLVSVKGPDGGVYCRSSGASLVATVTNGLPRYTFEWRNGNIPLAGDSARYILQGGGSYTVTATDSRGCRGTSTQAVSVIEKGGDLNALVTPPTGPTTVYAPSTVTLNAATGPDYTYQWKKDGKDIAGATTPTYVVTPEKDPGKAAYAITVGRDGCTATSQAITVEVIIPTAIGPVVVGEFSMKAFPSPTSGRIQVEVSLESPAPATMHLTDLNGRSLSTRVSPFADTRHVAEFDLSTHPNGLYLLRVEADGQHTVQKVVKAN